MPRLISRRHALGLGAALGSGAVAGAAIGPLGRPLPARAAAGSTLGSSLLTPRTDPVTMAMHIHASFSEGTGSMHAHLDQAAKAGVDVLWWTEHDFRVRAQGFRRAVRFDARVEPEDGADWTWLDNTYGPVAGAAGTFVAEPHSPHESGGALRLTATGPAEEWGRLQYDGRAEKAAYTTSIADTTLRLDVLAESLGPNAELVVEIASSYRPAAGGRPAGQYTLQYRVGGRVGRFTEADGLLGVVASRAGVGWHRLKMELAKDMAALWPDLVAGDAGLYRLRIAIRARRGATGSVVVDRLRFRRDRRQSGAEALALQAELMASYASRYPGVQQYQAGELSLVRHINRFGGTPFLPNYGDRPPVNDNSIEAAIAMVARVQRNGGLAAHNHPLWEDLSDPRDLARVLVETGNLGADLIEVGTEHTEEVTFAYDAAARNGVFVTATGSTDDHTGNDWLGRSQRWITSAWAASAEAPELLDTLAAGRAWFSDPAGWQGAMDIAAQGAPAMGGVLVTPDTRVPFEVTATDLPGGSTLEIVTGEVDYAGPDHAEPAITVEEIPARRVRDGRVRRDLTPGEGRYVRAVVRNRGGEIIGFSNPTWVFPRTPPGGIPPQREL